MTRLSTRVLHCVSTSLLSLEGKILSSNGKPKINKIRFDNETSLIFIYFSNLIIQNIITLFEYSYISQFIMEVSSNVRWNSTILSNYLIFSIYDNFLYQIVWLRIILYLTKTFSPLRRKGEIYFHSFFQKKERFEDKKR